MTKGWARRRRLLALAVVVAATTTVVPTAGGAVPSDATVEGTLRVAHGMPKASGPGESSPGMVMQAAVETRRGTVRIRVSDTRHDELMRLANRRVRVRGVEVSPTVLDAGAIAAADSAPTPPAAAASTMKIAVVLFDGTDAARTSAQQFFFGNDVSTVKSGFARASAGQVNVSGTVYGPTASGLSSTACDFFTWQEKADAALAKNGTSRGAFDHVVVYGLKSQCPYGGVALIRGNGVFIPGSPGWLGVVVHEVGHNLGAWHAASLQCTGAFSPSCPAVEYGDPHDRMGSGYEDYYSAYHRYQFGWIPSSGVTTVASGSQTVTLTQQDRAPADGGQRMLFVPRGDGTYFVVERSARPAAAGRVWVRLNCSSSSICPKAQRTDVQFIDMTPNSPSLSDGFLAAGRSFYDAQKDIRIETVADPDAGDAQVRVCFGCGRPTVPGVTVYKDRNTIVVEGTAGNDVVRLVTADGRRVIDANGAPINAGDGCEQYGDTSVRCRGGRLDLRLGAGNDRATVTSRVPTRFDGGTGDDTMSGARSTDVFVGGTGTDTVDYRGRNTDKKSGGPVVYTIGGGRVSGQKGERDDIGADIERVLTP